MRLPIILQMDNKGAVDLANSWSVTGRTRHASVEQNFIRELKEEGILKIEWIPTSKNSGDMLTKNLSGPDFAKHSSDIVSDEVYNETHK